MNKPLNFPVSNESPEDYMRRLISYSFAIARMYGKADGGPVSEPDYIKNALDLAAAVGTKGVTSVMGWPEQIKNAVSSTVDAAKLPGDVVTGKVDPLSDEGVRRAVDLAGLMTLGAGAMEAPAGALHAGLMRPKSQGIIAYHGSPHSFDRFDLSKIGTGEGAQAYGHGLYMAESEDVARQYRDSLSRDKSGLYFKEGARPEDVSTLEGIRNQHGSGSVEDLMRSLGRDRDHAISQAQGAYEKYMHDPARAETAANYFQSHALDSQNKIDFLINNSHRFEPYRGHMYQVRINADPEHFLDWDRPLSEHPEIVRRKLGWTPEAEAQYHSAQSSDDDALLSALEGGGSYTQSRIPVPTGLPPLSATGEDIVRGRSVFDRASDIEKANRLREAGIPGLKYLDQGSRAVGEGSRNYVVFDDNLIDILRKYAKGGEVDGLLEDRYPSHYMPGVGRQVMQDGGAPNYSAPITGQHTITLDDLIGRAPGPASQMGAYTDAGGQRISAPFVTSTAGGYPVYAPQTQPEKASNPYDVSGLLGRIFGKGRVGFAEGGDISDALAIANGLAA